MITAARPEMTINASGVMSGNGLWVAAAATRRGYRSSPLNVFWGSVGVRVGGQIFKVAALKRENIF